MEPNENEKIPGEVHRVDGIVELDNPPPLWWQSIFYISIVWAIAYGSYYLFGDGPTLKEELAAKLLKLETNRVATQRSEGDDEKLLAAVLDAPEKVAHGKEVYVKNCASCHAADGGGGIGPNLTDRAWLHGDGSALAILKVVRDGVAEKGMPPWGALLKAEDTLEVTAFVRNLNGTAPAKPKPPQGTEVTAKAGG